MRGAWMMGAAAVAGVLVSAAEVRAWPEATRTLTVKHVAGKPVEVRTSNGAIDVHRGGSSEVTITAKLQSGTDERLKKIKVKAERDEAGVLVIGVEWPDGKAQGVDGASFDVRVPDAAGVTAVTSNGAVTSAGLSGPASLETSNGAVEVRGHDGPVRIKTSNGRVKAAEVKGTLDAETDNGAVEALDIGGAVRAKSTNGAVTVRLEGANKGPVHAATSNGAVTLEVGAGFQGEVSASSNIGPVNVEVPAGVKVEKTGKSARVRFGPGEASSLSSATGGVTVRQRVSSDKGGE